MNYFIQVRDINTGEAYLLCTNDQLQPYTTPTAEDIEGLELTNRVSRFLGWEYKYVRYETEVALDAVRSREEETFGLSLVYKVPIDLMAMKVLNPEVLLSAAEVLTPATEV